MNILCITNNKGGVAKTTRACLQTQDGWVHSSV
jgi:hypothetical protein